MSNPAFRFDHVHIISENPKASAAWYVEMFGATITADTVARGAPQIFVELGGTTILIRGRRPGEAPVAARPIPANLSAEGGSCLVSTAPRTVKTGTVVTRMVALMAVVLPPD